jgi:hypothetical protein
MGYECSLASALANLPLSYTENHRYVILCRVRDWLIDDGPCERQIAKTEKNHLLLSINSPRRSFFSYLGYTPRQNSVVEMFSDQNNTCVLYLARHRSR